MQEVLSKAYKSLLEVIDNFANSSAEIKPSSEQTVGINNNATMPSYAYSCDNYIDTLLGNKIVQQALNAIAAKFYGNQLEEVVSKGSVLTADRYPVLAENYQHCCDTLNVTVRPKVIMTSWLSGINGLSAEVKGEAVIMLSYMFAVALDDAEQRFILGHELSHCQLGHLTAHIVQGLLQDLNRRAEILGDIIADFVEVPLNLWYRTSEFTADRGGYLCCRDIEAIRRHFLKLGMDREVTAYSEYKEVESAYPLFISRWDALKDFVNVQN